MRFARFWIRLGLEGWDWHGWREGKGMSGGDGMYGAVSTTR